MHVLWLIAVSWCAQPFFRDHKGQWLSNDVVLKALEQVRERLAQPCMLHQAAQMWLFLPSVGQGLADLAARRRDIGDRVEGAVPALPAAVVRLVCMYLP